MAENKECVVLVPVANSIEAECDRCLKELERRGYIVVRARGCSQIDLFRSQIASDFLREGFQETLWIDSDVAFSPDDVARLREHNLPIVCGLYPRKGLLSMAAKLLPNTPSINFGATGGLLEIRYAAGGFMHVRREVYDAIRRELPECNAFVRTPVTPYFWPIVGEVDGEMAYLSEDYSFCERARRAGFRIMADTRIRLWHIGSYRYSWEDAARQMPRHEAFAFPVSAISSPPS